MQFTFAFSARFTGKLSGCDLSAVDYTGQKATINQVTTMPATSTNVLFPGHNQHANHWYWWPDTLIIARATARVIIKVKGHQYQWEDGGYGLDIGYY